MSGGGTRDPLVAIGDAHEMAGLEAHAEFLRLSEAGEAAALVTVIGAAGSAPRGMGAAMAVRADGSIVGTVGGGQLEMLVIEHALEAIADSRPRRYRYDFSGGPEQNLDKACIGRNEFFIQPCGRRPRLYICGAGHIGAALAPMAQQAGFLVSLIDDREGYPASAVCTGGIRGLSGPFVETIESLAFDETTSVVVVTYGHLQDEAVLRVCLHKPWGYLGMIGSKAKVARTFRALDEDAASHAQLARIHAPIGLDIGGRAPGEIAVGVVAELIAVRYGREGLPEMRERMKSRGAGKDS